MTGLERTTHSLLLDDFKQARGADLNTAYALADAWSAYIDKTEAELAELREKLKYAQGGHYMALVNELTTLQEAVREHLERWECGGRLRQLVEGKP